MAKTVKRMRCNSDATDIKKLMATLNWELHAELVSQNLRNSGDTTVLLLIFEKYYFRTGSYASLTIMLMVNDYEQLVDIIGHGGGNGLANASLGANTDFADSAVRVFQQFGFEEVR